MDSGLATAWRPGMTSSMVGLAQLLRLDLAFDDHRLPLLVFRLQESGALVRRAAARLDADLREGGLYLLFGKRLPDVAIESGKDIGRQSGRRENAKPEIDLET